MFERYTERARRVIFFARYEASQYGSSYIESEHLLLGLEREDKRIIQRFVTGADFDVRQRVEAHITPRPKTSTSIDLPLTVEARRILAYANEETDRLGHRRIDVEHLLLGILRETGSVAAQVLDEIGIKRHFVRDVLGVSGEESGPRADESLPPADRPSLHELVDQIPEEMLARAKWLLARLLQH